MTFQEIIDKYAFFIHEEYQLHNIDGKYMGTGTRFNATDNKVTSWSTLNKEIDDFHREEKYRTKIYKAVTLLGDIVEFERGVGWSVNGW